MSEEKEDSNFIKKWKKNIRNPYFWIAQILAGILLYLFFTYGGLLGL